MSPGAVVTYIFPELAIVKGIKLLLLLSITISCKYKTKAELIFYTITCLILDTIMHLYFSLSLPSRIVSDSAQF